MTIDNRMKRVRVLRTVSVKDDKWSDIIADPDVEPWFLIGAWVGHSQVPKHIGRILIVTRGDSEYRKINVGLLHIGGIDKFTDDERPLIQEAIEDYVGEL